MRKRRRQLALPEAPGNKVSKDLGGTVPGPLFRYLRDLGDTGKSKEGLNLWGYQKVLEFSRSVSNKISGDVLVILGVHEELTAELGKTVYLLYSKEGYPDTLMLVTHEETGNLEVYKEVGFGLLS